MLRRLLVVVLDVFAVAEEIQPSPETIYYFPINQYIFRMTSGTHGINSVARQPPPGRLGIRQTNTCPSGSIETCPNSTLPCCAIGYPNCCAGGTFCCSTTSRCVQTTNGTTCCLFTDIGCAEGCCPADTTCCGKSCCSADSDCKLDSSGTLNCTKRVVESVELSSLSSLSEASSRSQELSSISQALESAITEKLAQDAKKKNDTTIGVATGVSVGIFAIAALLFLGIFLHKRRNRRKAAQEVQTNQNQMVDSSQAPIHPRSTVALRSSRQHNQVTHGWNRSQPPATAPLWSTGNPSFQRDSLYYGTPVHTPTSLYYSQEIGTSAPPLQPDLGPGAEK